MTTARRLLKPTYESKPEYWQTLGPEVGEICAAAGFAPDPVQQYILDHTFAVTADRKMASFNVDIIGPRQNFKTGVLKMMEIGWLFVTQEPLIVHSAHELRTTEETFGEVRHLIEDTPMLAKHLDPEIGEPESPGMVLGNGRWAIHLVDEDGRRSRIIFKARTKVGGRGLAAPKVVLDEAFALTRRHVGSLWPLVAAKPRGQIITASSAGQLESEFLRKKRDRGRAGNSPRLFYIEYCDNRPNQGCKTKDCDHKVIRKGCALDDERRWKKFMTALGTRIDIETIRAMRLDMPEDEFAREFMVWWEDPPNAGEGGVLDIDRWGLLQDRQVKKPTRAGIFLAVAPNRKKASIGVAGTVQVLDKNGTTHDRTLVMARTQPRWEWVVPALERMLSKQDIAEVALHPASQAQLLLPALRDAEIDFTPITTQDAGRATASFIEAVHADEPRIVHLGQPELDEAVGTAITKYSASGEVELWDQRDRSIDITALVAASGAFDRWAMQDDYDVMDSFL